MACRAAGSLTNAAVRDNACVPRIGLVVHPSRDIAAPLEAVREWASKRDAEIAQVPVEGQRREVADWCEARDVDLVLAVGGDGTTLAAMHAAAQVDRPILGVACGSLGVLTSVPATQVATALERFIGGDWVQRTLPALGVQLDGAPPIAAFNDIAVVREGQGQVRTIAEVDGVLYCRFAGDGCIVSTPAGSSAYTIAAGGPMLAPGVSGFVLTPLPAHGGSCPPLVLSAHSELRLRTTGFGGVRLEVDGRIAHTGACDVTIRFLDSAATVVSFDDQEPLLTGLRRRNVIADSPRIIADDGRVIGHE
jgi:NAD+ kinase